MIVLVVDNYPDCKILHDLLVDEIKRLRKENFELKKRLEYIECMTKGMLHKDLVKIITNEEVKQK